ncbi:MAG: DUF348 domain-containing protein [Caldilineaceae bacterium]|nr:DUF348 domain-containing protein [Caldilineaceae bacterium]
MSTVTLPRRSRYRPVHVARRLPALLSSSIGSLAVGILLWGIWSATAVPIRITVDGIAEDITTHRKTVGAVLLDLGIPLQDQDRVTPAPATRLRRKMVVSVERARTVKLWADGRELVLSSWGETPRSILAETELDVGEYDQVVMNGQVLALDTELPLPEPVELAATYSRGYLWNNQQTEPLQLRLERAIPITVRDGGLPFTIRTTAQTVGEALRQAEVTIYLGDLVQPTLGSQVTPGLRISIQRSKPVTLEMNNGVLKTRTRAPTVGEALIEIGVGISGLDQVEPALNTPVRDELRIAVTRVHEEIEVTEEIVPFETVFQPDPQLPIDSQAVQAVGAEGITRQRYRIRYEDGVEVSRILEDRWVAQEPAQRIIAYGQAIEPKTATMPDGTPITYWRKVRMFASSYSAATAGLAEDHPWYGRTYSGEPMRKGVVAVDPRVIPLRTKVFVPGYGNGEALDTGTAILARRIDLGYDNDNLQLWSRWVDVYLLWPPPPAQQITWVIPNYPRVPN